jgi:peptidoglycan/LPS O-acetylase OafA/YrhL
MGRNRIIDFFRFIGVALTMFAHLSITRDRNRLTAIDKMLGHIAWGGWTGVDLFFVISGFLVSGLIFKEYDKYGGFKPGLFLIRRGFKIYPTYYIFLVVSLFIFHDEMKLLLSEALFVANYTGYNHIWVWSVCVEEHFYFFLCLYMFILIRSNKVNLRYILGTYLVFIVAGLGFRLYNYFYLSPYTFFAFYTKSHFRFDSLFFGVLLYYLYNYRPHIIQHILSSRYSKLLLAAAIGYVLLAFVFPSPNNQWESVASLAILPWCFGYIFIYFVTDEKYERKKWLAPFSYLGKYSYSIYLFHGLVDHYCSLHLHGYFSYIFYFVISIVSGVVISKLIEYPMLALRDKYFPSRSRVEVEKQMSHEEGIQLATAPNEALELIDPE